MIKKQIMHSIISSLRPFSFLVLFLIAALSLSAQDLPLSENVESDYRLDSDGKIHQRISWLRVNAFYYELEIEKIIEGGIWAPELRQRTDQTFLELTLPPGMYRYRIHGYNVLDRIGSSSEWFGIRVFAAKEPKAESFSPEAYFVDSLMEEFTMIIAGHDLDEEAQAFLRLRKPGAKPIPAVSVKYKADQTTLTAVFSAGDLAIGKYDIIVVNPGGMSQTIQGFSVVFTVGFSSPYDINISAGYAPLIPLHGYLFDSFTSGIYPLGFYGRVSYVPDKRLWGWLGVELTPQYTGLKTESDDYSVSGNMFSLSAAALYQKWFINYTVSLNFRLGAGFTSISNIKFDHDDGSSSKEMTASSMNMTLGASASLFFRKNIFIEGGAEYTMLVSSGSPLPGFMRLSAAAGYRF
jgi:hypothetical protein